MGYSFGWHSKQDLVRSILKDESTNRVLSHAFRGNAIWVVRKHDCGDAYIALYLISGSSNDRNGFGYKVIMESDHPARIDCPLQYLELTKDTTTYQSSEWRRAVKEHAEKRSRIFEIGDILQYGTQFLVVEERLKYGHWLVRTMENQVRKLPRKWVPNVHVAIRPLSPRF